MTQFAEANTRQPEPDLRGMSTLLDLRRRADRQEWQPSELKDMLLHQLRAPLYLSLGALSAEVAHQLQCNEPPLDARLTLGELFGHPQPPLELLKLVKRFAKQCRREPDNPMPSDLVMLLYFVSIPAALVRLDQRISELADRHLRHGMRWLATRLWVDAQVKSLLMEALHLLRDLAAVLHLQGRVTAALEAYGRAIALAPANAQLYVNRGWSLDAANRLADAEADFRKALELARDHAEAMTGLAYVLARQGQRDEAQQRASLALLADPKDYRILHNAACVYAALSVTDSTRATTHQDAAVRLLERALTAWRGGWGGPDEAELIRDEPAFPRSMRQREDFKRLLPPLPSTAAF